MVEALNQGAEPVMCRERFKPTRELEPLSHYLSLVSIFVWCTTVCVCMLDWDELLIM